MIGLLAYVAYAGAKAVSPYDIRLGLPEAEWQGMVANTLGHVERGYIVAQILKMPGDETLVRWASSSSLDPKGPNGVGVQIYGADGKFERWLNGAARIDRAFVQCGPYVVGGGNTLRVWDSGQKYALINRKTVPNWSRWAALGCQGNVLRAVTIAGEALSVFEPLRLPELVPLH